MDIISGLKEDNDDVSADPEDGEELAPGERMVEVAEDDDETPAADAPPGEEERKSRQTRRAESRAAHEERKYSERFAAERVEIEKRARMTAFQEFQATQKAPEPQKSADPFDNPEIKKLEKESARLLRLMKSSDTPDDEIPELQLDYKRTQYRLGQIAFAPAPVQQQPQMSAEAVYTPILQADFPDIYSNEALRTQAAQRLDLLRKQDPGAHPYALVRRALTETRAAIAKTKVTANQAARYGAPATTGGAANNEGGRATHRLTKKQENLALETYVDKDWTDAKKIETWVKNLSKRGML